MFSLFMETMFLLTELEHFTPINTHPNVVLTATGASKFPRLMICCKWSCGMSAPSRTPNLQLLDNSSSSTSLRWSNFSLIWAMGNLLFGNSIPALSSSIFGSKLFIFKCIKCRALFLDVFQLSFKLSSHQAILFWR